MVKRIIKHSSVADEENVNCTERLCMALSSTLLHEANHERMLGTLLAAKISYVCSMRKHIQWLYNTHVYCNLHGWLLIFDK